MVECATFSHGVKSLYRQRLGPTTSMQPQQEFDKHETGNNDAADHDHELHTQLRVVPVHSQLSISS